MGNRMHSQGRHVSGSGSPTSNDRSGPRHMSCTRSSSCSGNTLNSIFTPRVLAKSEKVYDAWFPLSVAYGGHTSRYVRHFVEPLSRQVAAEYECSCGIVASKTLNSTAAIHLRCADVPFSRHRDYHLPHLAYYEFVLARLIESRKLHQIHSLIILNASEHTDKLRPGKFPTEDERRACDRLAYSIATYYRRHRFRVTHFQGSASEALQVMLGAHTLVSTSPSSFSFFAGLTKRPAKRFITTEWYREELIKSSMKSSTPPGAPSEQASKQASAGRPAVAPSPPCGVRPIKFAERFVAFQYVGRSQRDGTPCPGLLATRAVFAANFTEWVPWSVFREPQPLLHGQIASRAEYVALVESMSRTLRGAAARFAIPK